MPVLDLALTRPSQPKPRHHAGAPGAAPEGSPDASNANSNAASGGGGQSDQQTLLRLAQIRTARAEVQAAQARLAELETHTALAASQAAMGQGATTKICSRPRLPQLMLLPLPLPPETILPMGHPLAATTTPMLPTAPVTPAVPKEKEVNRPTPETSRLPKPSSPCRERSSKIMLPLGVALLQLTAMQWLPTPTPMQ